MKLVKNLDELRVQIAEWRRAGERIAFVPTMGNLHVGHLELVTRARSLADRVVASVFVNPMQFGPSEDLDAYPRTLEADGERLAGEGADLLFAPAVADVYPRGSEVQTRVEVPGISDILCGASRPGHFVGVATVVCKLFNMVQPDVAVFGDKDFQQLMVIRLMTADLCMPIAIEGIPTVREADGLAMSSRNGYLTADQRVVAPALYQTLRQAAVALAEGGSIAGVEAAATEALAQAGLHPDYFSVRRAADLQTPKPSDQELVILAAAYLGKARLIDNIRVSR